MSEPNTERNVDGLSLLADTDAVDRVDDLTVSWNRPPDRSRRGPGSGGKPIEDHGDDDESGSGKRRTGL